MLEVAEQVVEQDRTGRRQNANRSLIHGIRAFDRTEHLAEWGDRQVGACRLVPFEQQGQGCWVGGWVGLYAPTGTGFLLDIL